MKADVQLSPDDILNSLAGVCYVVDMSGTITALGSKNWDSFALHCGNPSLCEHNGIVGSSMFDHIDGDDIRLFYRRVLTYVTSGYGNDLSFYYRCDGPDTRRDMQMSITPMIRNGRIDGVIFQSQLLNEQFRPYLSIFDTTQLDSGNTAGDPERYLGVCGFCAKVRYPSGPAVKDSVWVEGPMYFRMGGAEDIIPSHTICDTCRKIGVDLDDHDPPSTNQR